MNSQNLFSGLLNKDFGDKYLATARKYSKRLFEKKTEHESILMIDQLYQIIMDDVGKVSNYYLSQLCCVFIDYCEITNDWIYWKYWTSKLLNDQFQINCLIYYGLGRYCEEIENFEMSTYYHRQGLYLAKQSNYERGIALNCLGIGITLNRVDNKRAIGFLKIAKTLFFKNHESYYLGCTYSDLGGYYLRDEKTLKSIGYFILAIFTHRIKRYDWDLGRIYYSLASALLHNKHLSKLSLPILNTSVKYSEQTSIRYYALSLYGLGRYFYRTKHYFEALEKLNVAINLYDDFFSKNQAYYENLLNIYVLLAHTHIKLNNFNEARRYFSKIEKIIEEEQKSSRNRIFNRPYTYKIVLFLAEKLKIEEIINKWKNKYHESINQ
jgi:tetratricopeptide (TPR) repeat protein